MADRVPTRREIIDGLKLIILNEELSLQRIQAALREKPNQPDLRQAVITVAHNLRILNGALKRIAWN